MKDIIENLVMRVFYDLCTLFFGINVGLTLDLW